MQNERPDYLKQITDLVNALITVHKTVFTGLDPLLMYHPANNAVVIVSTDVQLNRKLCAAVREREGERLVPEYESVVPSDEDMEVEPIL